MTIYKVAAIKIWMNPYQGSGNIFYEVLRRETRYLRNSHMSFDRTNLYKPPRCAVFLARLKSRDLRGKISQDNA